MITLVAPAPVQPSALRAMVGNSDPMVRLRALLVRIARSPASTVLITGESGTGKDLAARAIHACSRRAVAPFVNVTCSALPGTLLESELFGHERGAFTDAKARRRGLVEEADGGTLFLDEVGEIDVLLQSKLLRFLEEKAFRRVGGNEDLRADVRVVAATNVDLRRAVSEGRFREDLYYRLAVLTAEMPALRDRQEDVPDLVDCFVARFQASFEGPTCTVTERAMARLSSHGWPGNVRELRNAVERAVVLTETGVLDPQDFELSSESATTTEDVFALPADGVCIEDVERSLVSQALARTQGNVTRAGHLLGLSRDQVRYRIRKFGLLS